MTDGFCLLYEGREQFNLDDLVEEFGRSRITLANPMTGEVTMWSEFGEQLFVSAKFLSQRLRDGERVTFQWWFDASVDILCTIRPLSKHVLCQDFGLTALTREEVDRLLHTLEERFRRIARQGQALGFVADREGVSWNFNWDALVLESGSVTGCGLPEVDVIGMKRQQLEVLDRHVVGLSREKVGDFVILRGS